MSATSWDRRQYKYFPRVIPNIAHYDSHCDYVISYAPSTAVGLQFQITEARSASSKSLPRQQHLRISDPVQPGEVQQLWRGLQQGGNERDRNKLRAGTNVVSMTENGAETGRVEMEPRRRPEAGARATGTGKL